MIAMPSQPAQWTYEEGPSEIALLIQAANYTGNPDAPYCEAARKAVDAWAEAQRIRAELALDELRKDPRNEGSGVG